MSVLLERPAMEAAMEADRALSTSVCAHICSGVNLVRLSLAQSAPLGLFFDRDVCLTRDAQGEQCRFDSVSETAIHGLADLLAACASATQTRLSRLSPPCLCLTLARGSDIGELGSAAQAEAELTGRKFTSNLPLPVVPGSSLTDCL